MCNERRVNVTPEQFQQVFKSEYDDPFFFETGDISLHQAIILDPAPRVLGKGAFGVVLSAQYGGLPVAIKITRDLAVGRHEHAILSKLQTEQSIETLLLRGFKLRIRYESESLVHSVYYYVLILHRMKCTLYRCIRPVTKARMAKTLTRVQSAALSILQQLQLIHQCHVIHTDLKPDNVMLAPDYSLRIVDFGMAQLDDVKRIEWEYLQTLPYRAPEFTFFHSISPAMDMFSVGCILFEMMTGHLLFPIEDSSQLKRMYPLILGTVPDEYASVVAHVIATKTPGEQVDECIRQLVPDDLLQTYEQFKDLLGHLLTWTPHDRWTASQALKHPFVCV